MAKYERQILVPYLQDVCCVEMLCHRLEQDIQNARAESEKYNRWANAAYEDPKMPEWEDYAAGNREKTDGIISLIVYGGLGLLLWMALPFLGMIGIGLGIMLFLDSIFEQENCNKLAKKNYDAAMETYKENCEIQKKNREHKLEWRDESHQWKIKADNLKGKLNEARALRNNAYAVNIIPARYRNIHAAYYLYDYFNTCREDDLDKIIQTMLLDEIVQRMDKLIVQNQEIILNQRMQIAIQETQNRAIAEQHQQKMKAIARMEQNQELQIDYQKMIARNQEVTNFFLAADYLRKNR